MSVCDVCNSELSRPEGYLLTTKQVVSNPAYWEYAFSHAWSYVNGMSNAERIKGGLAEQQARQNSPWLLCRDCAERMDAATDQAFQYAQQWWSSGQTFSPPGCGAVPLSEVRLTRTSTASAIPRPTRILVYGRGFLPGSDDIMVAAQGLVLNKSQLTLQHFKDIPVECERRDTSERMEFFAVVDQVRNINPAAFILDSLCLDQKTGHDSAILAIWEGSDAAAARRALGESSGTVGKTSGVATAISPSQAIATKPPFLSAWTIWSFVPWLNWIAWIHAALRTGRGAYAFFALIYIVPLIVLLSQPQATGGKQPPDWIISIQSMFWIGGIVHTLIMRKGINKVIAARESQQRRNG